MLTKFLIFVAVIFGVFVVARLGASSAIRPRLRKKKGSDARVKDAEDFAPCPSCGAWVARGQGCSCQNTPTP